MKRMSKENIQRCILLGMPGVMTPSVIENVVEVSDIPVSDTDKDKLFDSIYSVDPVTGRVKNALPVLLSDKVDLKVKDFVMKNLGRQTVGREIPQGMSDDDVEYFERGQYETQAEYISRISARLDKYKEMNLLAAESRKLNDLNKNE